MYTIYDFIGNIGVFFIIIAFLLLQLNKIKSENVYYSIMNLIGAAFVIISLLNNFNFSAFIIEAFWIVISLIGIVNYLRKRQKYNG